MSNQQLKVKAVVSEAGCDNQQCTGCEVCRVINTRGEHHCSECDVSFYQPAGRGHEIPVISGERVCAVCGAQFKAGG